MACSLHFIPSHIISSSFLFPPHSQWSITPFEWESGHSVVSYSLRPHGLWPTRLLCPWDFSGKSSGVGCHFLLHGIFLTQGSNPGLPNCRQMLYHVKHQGSLPGASMRNSIVAKVMRKEAWHTQRRGQASGNPLFPSIYPKTRVCFMLSPITVFLGEGVNVQLQGNKNSWAWQECFSLQPPLKVI